MAFADKLKSLAGRVPQTLPLLETEEATKNALVMPFIGALGYDVFNPEEVVPEFTADVGTKKGEKVDYAIKHDGSVIILVEAKSAATSLGNIHTSQLYRYFSVTQARIAILTNGVSYRFYSDLEEPNKLDERPFLTIDLQSLREDHLAQVKKLSKETFDLDNILSVANDLKYLGEIRALLEQQLTEPQEDFVQYFFNRTQPGKRFVQSAREQFAPLVRRALEQVVADKVSERLRSALEHTEAPEAASSSAPPAAIEQCPAEAEPDAREGVETTDEELEGFRIVRAIVCGVLPASRVVHRDAKSYFGVLCDDNNRRPICRLHFNRSKKYVGLFDADKNETRHELSGGPESLYDFAEQLRATAQRYLEPDEQV